MKYLVEFEKLLLRREELKAMNRIAIKYSLTVLFAVLILTAGIIEAVGTFRS